MVRKREKRIALICVLVLILAILGAWAYANRPVQFCSNFPFWLADCETTDGVRDLTKQIYRAHEQVLDTVKVAEDGQRDSCVRFTFIAESTLEDSVVEDILHRIYAYMSNLLTEGRYRDIRFCWEVFFCTQDHVERAYVSLYGTYSERYGN